jgi:hypothetical protein
MKLLRRHALFRIKRGEPIPAIAPRGEVIIRQVTRENVADILAFRTAEYEEVFKRQLEKGQLGVYAYRDGKAVAHGWMIVNRGGRRIRANGYFVLQPREALVHFCNVAEAHRGMGIYQAMLCEMYRLAFASEPVDTIYIDTVIDNLPSRKAIEKTAQFLSNTYYFNLFSKGFRIPWQG